MMGSFVDKSDVKISIEKDVLKKQLALSENKIIMFVGRFHKEKGVDVLVKAFKKLFQIDKKVVLVMIGEGEEEKMLREYCSVNNLPVHILSPKKNIFDYYNIADIIVLPSRIDPFPFVMLETGLIQKPFIGSDVDGISELIKHRVNGLLFESENVSELVNSIQMILEDKELAAQLAKKLNNDVITNHSVEKVITSYIEFFKLLV
jgi:glycosyltransferase involved in cell wall biosynthesis